MIRGRKGASHLEFILSFVIFILFLVFLYGGIDPIVKSAGSKQFVLSHLKSALTENLTLSDFTTETIIIEISHAGPISNSDCIVFKGEDSSRRGRSHSRGLGDLILFQEDLVIRDSSGNIIYYDVDYEDKEINLGPLRDEFKDDRILKAYYAEGFENSKVNNLDNYVEDFLEGYEDGLEDCLELGHGDYVVKSSVQTETIGESNIQAICDSYNTDTQDYENLKDSLGVPSGSDFSFVFKDAEGNQICPNPDKLLSPPDGLNIYVGDIPIQYVDNDATAKIGFLTIQVW